HCPDADAEVVRTAPDRQIVLCAEVAAAIRTAEVRRLVPAVTGASQRLHDTLYIALHGLGLAGELLPVRVREPRPRLRLELVAGEVLRLERKGVREVRLEIGGALARNAVDEIERNVVEPGITESVDRPSDVVGAGNALEHPEQVRPERLRAQRDAADAVVTQQQGKGGRDRLRIGLDGDLGRRRERVECAGERFGLREGGRPTSHEHRLERAGENPALAVELREKRVDVAPMLLAAAPGGDEVAVAAPLGAERQVDVQMADAADDPGRRKT